MSKPLDAAIPENSATVHASAGTGKTWLLVTRLIRLLLHGQQPGNLLALTFTRKAAAEMQERLQTRIREFACADDENLQQQLEEIGVKVNAATMDRARCLYEQVLHAEYPVRITTFHAFCQDLLLRFPLEGAVPPGFELLEAPYTLERQALNSLYQSAGQGFTPQVSESLDYLFRECKTLHTCVELASRFLDNRINWWAFTLNQPDPVDYATQQLAQTLQLEDTVALSDEEILQQLFSAAFNRSVSRLADWIGCHTTKTAQANAHSLSLALDDGESPLSRFARIQKVVSGNFSRAYDTKPFKKAIGDSRFAEFSDEFHQVKELIDATQNLLERMRIYRLSSHWYRVGEALLNRYQNLKGQLRYLDFYDLEWQTFCLLNHSNNNEWVQYKLDQRIDHILIDEFQDTSPIQWQLLHPLLTELEANRAERARSVFMVGDAKQSIYQFRGANPELFDEASQWLSAHMQALHTTLNKSRRSSPAVIQAVNHVFEHPLLQRLLPHFDEHETFETDMWGEVCLLPVLEAQMEDSAEAEISSAGFRNPLLQPRATDNNRHFELEAQQLVDTIQRIVNDPTPVLDGGQVRPANYSDIILLFRTRSHVKIYEQQLTRAGIPFIGTDKGTFLQCLEIQDLCTLLDLLTSPHDNLKLAQVLKSPLFAIQDTSLEPLAGRDAGRDGGSWYSYLQEHRDDQQLDATLRDAWQQLSQWRDWVNRIPVHDFLDKIYNESAIVSRYCQAFPHSLHARVRVNFSKFIDLALEFESGRYPSVSRFLSTLKTLASNPMQAPNTPSFGGDLNRIRLMTVHASKGLEAPIIILADANSSPGHNDSYWVLSHWSATEAIPGYFFACPSACKNNTSLTPMLQQRSHEEQTQDANLLYVALTRARQYLYVSAAATSSKSESLWYRMIRSQLEPHGESDGDCLRLSYGKPPKPFSRREELPGAQEQPLRAALQVPEVVYAAPEPPDSFSDRTLNPSGVSHAGDAPDAKEAADADNSMRGEIIHRMLELRMNTPGLSGEQLARLIQQDHRFSSEQHDLAQYCKLVEAVIDHPQHRHLFDPKQYVDAFNEIPVYFKSGARSVAGIIDRLVLTQDCIWVVDFKTHQAVSEQTLQQYCEQFRPQLALYAEGVKQLWPDKIVRPCVLFTEINRLVDVD